MLSSFISRAVGVCWKGFFLAQEEHIYEPVPRSSYCQLFNKKETIRSPSPKTTKPKSKLQSTQPHFNNAIVNKTCGGCRGSNALCWHRVLTLHKCVSGRDADLTGTLLHPAPSCCFEAGVDGVLCEALRASTRALPFH